MILVIFTLTCAGDFIQLKRFKESIFDNTVRIISAIKTLQTNFVHY
jgi:hypothetical protein